MRDIRPDLKERLLAVGEERKQITASIQPKLDKLDAEEAGIMALLAAEERRFAGAAALPKPSHLVAYHADDNGFGRTPLSRLIMEILKQTKRPTGLQDFKRFATEAGFNFGEQSPGRTLHWALVGLTENGYLECRGEGRDRRYQLKEQRGESTK